MNIFSKKYNVTLEQIENVLRQKTWWAGVAILPVARRLILLICNYTNIKPNTITLFSLFLRIVSAVCFLKGDKLFFVFGAIIFELAYVFDCVDGAVARLKKQSSPIGMFLDHVTDAAGIIINIIALSWSQNIFFSINVFLVITIYLYINFMTFVAETLFFKYEICLDQKNGQSSLNIKKNGKFVIWDWIVKSISKYRKMFFQKNYKAFFSLPDFEAFLCFFCPLFGIVKKGFNISVYVLLMIFLYKIFSYIYVITVHSQKTHQNF